MANEHALRSRKIATNNKQTSLNNTTLTKQIGTKKKISTESSTARTLSTSKATAASVTAPSAVNSRRSSTTNCSQPRISNVSKAPISTRLSSVSNSSAQKKTGNLNAPSEVKILSEKITQFESKIGEIISLYEQLKEENFRLQYVVAELTELQTKFVESEESSNQLRSENENLRTAIVELKSEISELSSRVQCNQSTDNENLQRISSQFESELSVLSGDIQQLKSTKSLSFKQPDTDQQLLNCNIIIRGADAKIDTPESDLLAVYSGLRSHLGIADVAEFDPISIKTINTNSVNKNTAKPIQVQLQSVGAKRKFLQVRRVKKNISQIDIGIKGTTSHPILVTEELTRSNQELLFQARSLRGQTNYKFVWSRQNSKVIRIVDSSHVNQLRSALNLEPFSDHGRHHSGASIGSS